MDPAARWRPQLSDDGDVAIKLEEEEESLLITETIPVARQALARLPVARPAVARSSFARQPMVQERPRRLAGYAGDAGLSTRPVRQQTPDDRDSDEEEESLLIPETVQIARPAAQ